MHFVDRQRHCIASLENDRLSDHRNRYIPRHSPSAAGALSWETLVCHAMSVVPTKVFLRGHNIKPGSKDNTRNEVKAKVIHMLHRPNITFTITGGMLCAWSFIRASEGLTGRPLFPFHSPDSFIVEIYWRSKPSYSPFTPPFTSMRAATSMLHRNRRLKKETF